jgi:hypothetical protein
VIAEIGVHMSRFSTAGHLISWAGLCPRNDESAGKRRSTRMRKGAPWLKTTLIRCAWAATRTKGSYLQAQFHRLRARRGAKKAIGAVAASILIAAYHMLKNGILYQDLGPNHFDIRAKSKHNGASGRTPASPRMDQVEKDSIRSVSIAGHALHGQYKKGGQFDVTIPDGNETIDRLLQHQVEVEITDAGGSVWMLTLLMIGPVLLLMLF